MRGKRYKEAINVRGERRKLSVDEAFKLLTSMPKAKFDETVDVACKLGIDPKKSDQLVRGSIVLPHGTGKTVRVLVFAKGEKQKEAQDAGADIVGGEELIERIKGGWQEFDRVISTPDMMASVSKVGKILGPLGLMPNPKMGTVTFDVKQAVDDQKRGKIEFRVDKDSNLHAVLGKISFGAEKLSANFKDFMDAVLRAKPSSAKGVYMQNVVVSTSMSPGVVIDSGLFV